MEAGTIVHASIFPYNLKRKAPRGQSLPHFRAFVRASSNSKSYIGPKPSKDWVADLVSNNDSAVRSLPIYIGGASLLAVLFNRAASGIAPVADASSSQSRADLLTLGLAVTNILTGLIWLTIRPRSISAVNPQGVECRIICSCIPDFVVSELLWSLVVVYDSTCILQIGVAAESPNKGEPLVVDAPKLRQGSLYQAVMKLGAQNYLANLSLYPGRSELPFFPSNTQNVLSDVSEVLGNLDILSVQAVILQPLGDKGIAIIGGDTIRGFTTSDQAWITFLGEKLDATLRKYVVDSPLAAKDRV